MRSCGVFEFPDNTASCTLENLPSELKDENTQGPMQGLPGGCEVQQGPEQAMKGKGASGSSSGGKSGGKSDGGPKGSDSGSYSSPAAAPAAAPAAPPAVENKKAGAVFAQVKDTGDNYKAPPPTSPTTTPAPPTTTPPAVMVPVSTDQAGNVVSTEIWTDGRIVHENKIVMQEVTVTQGGVKAKRSPEAKAEHVKRHGHRHHHPMQHGVGGRRM